MILGHSKHHSVGVIDGSTGITHVIGDIDDAWTQQLLAAFVRLARITALAT